MRPLPVRQPGSSALRKVSMNALFVSSNRRGSLSCSKQGAAHVMTDVEVTHVQGTALGAKPATPALQRAHARANEIIEARRALIAELEQRRRVTAA